MARYTISIYQDSVLGVIDHEGRTLEESAPYLTLAQNLAILDVAHSRPDYQERLKSGYGFGYTLHLEELPPPKPGVIEPLSIMDELSPE